MENSQVILKIKGFVTGVFMLLAFLVFSCRDREPQHLPETNGKDAAIREQVDESMEKARELAGPDSTVGERNRDSVQADSVKKINDSIR